MTRTRDTADIRQADQLALLDVPTVPKLTDRQQRAHDAIAAAGYDGLTSDELGAHMHDRHPDDDRCQFCGSTGNELGRALRSKGLVQQRRRRAPGGDHYMVWTVVGKLEEPKATESNAGAVPYNEFPPGFGEPQSTVTTGERAA